MLKILLKVSIYLVILNQYVSYAYSPRDERVSTIEEVEDQCPICCDRQVDTQLNCNHTMCHRCTVRIFETSARCPFCRSEINSYTPYCKNSRNSQRETSETLETSNNNDTDYYDSVNRCFSNIRHGHLDKIFECFETMGVNERDENGNTPLIVAAQNGMVRIVKHLLRWGADINAQNIRGQTALHYTSMYGYLRLQNYLIKKGADDRIRNEEGDTCYDLEISSDYSSDRSSARSN